MMTYEKLYWVIIVFLLFTIGIMGRDYNNLIDKMISVTTTIADNLDKCGDKK